MCFIIVVCKVSCYSVWHLTQKSFWKILLDELQKPDLMTLAKELKYSMRKQEIMKMLIDRLVDDDLLDSFNLDNKVLIDDRSDSTVKLKQLDIQKEMEMAKFELEKAIKQQK